MTSPASRPPEAEPAPADQGPIRAIWSERALWGLIALIVASGGVDLFYLGRFNPWAVGLRVMWVLNLLILKWVRGSPQLERVMLYVSIAISNSAVVGLAVLMGGLGTPYFLVVPIMPLGAAFTGPLQRDRGATYTSGAVAILSTLLLVLWQQRPVAESVMWVLVPVTTTILADFLTFRVTRALRTEQEVRLERARRESLEALALSEHRRAQSEKLATVGRLASGVAHEINNPLAYVGSNVDFVRDELMAPREIDREQLADVLAETRVGLQHIQQIVTDLRGFARMDAQEPSACSLVDVVADAMKLGSLRLRHVAWLRVDVPTALPEVFVVRQRLVQVVLNLLVNAGDALEMHQVQGGEVLITGRSEPQRVVLLIEDNGPGFAPHVLSRLFEAFFTTKSVDRGTGLGLNLSRELVEQFGGRLTASNRPEGGARLRIELPVRNAVHPEPSPHASESLV